MKRNDLMGTGMNMLFVANAVVCLVAAAHFYACYKEMTDWPRLAKGLAGIATEHGEATKVIGWNQGLYNHLFAVGLVVSVFALSGQCAIAVKVYCLGALAVAGLGAFYLMGNVKVLVMQTGLSGLALLLIWLS